MSCDLSLLDLTAAFYTIDHDIRLTKLECQFGLPGVVLDGSDPISPAELLGSYLVAKHHPLFSSYARHRHSARVVSFYSVHGGPRGQSRRVRRQRSYVG